MSSRKSYLKHRDAILARAKEKYRNNPPERLKTIWKGIIQRCCNPLCRKYKDYGARGIEVCDEWKFSYESFNSWSYANGYSDEMTIDRIVNTLGYMPGNCRWVTMHDQNRNKTNNVMLEYNGTTMCMSDWARHFGVSPQAIWHLLNKKHFNAQQVIEHYINK